MCAAAEDGSAPRRIDDYRILGLLGSGGVGVVYRAQHVGTGELVALKTVRARSTSHLGSVRREILALHRLRHPGIVRILDGGVNDGRPWYAMELLTGHTLAQALGASHHDVSTMSFRIPSQSATPGAKMPGERVRAPAAGGRLIEMLTLFRLLCAPLAYLHGEGTVHRDIKPSNVFVRPDGTPVLMDFGLVGRWRGALGREILEETQTIGGTLVYMAPEQVRGESGDARSDLYSLGCTLYEALTGMVPIEDVEPGADEGARGDIRPVPPSEIVTGIPPALDMLVMRLLEKDPRERLGHADDVAQALSALGAKDWPRQGLPHARAYLYQPRLVGRDGTLRAVLEGIDSCKKVGGLLLIGGESGVGKTSLASEAARIAFQREHQVVTSECRCPGSGPGQIERSPPLQPFRPLLRHIVEHCRAAGADATGRIVGRWRRLLSTIEPTFAELSGPASEPPDLPVQAALERMLAALSDTIIAFARETTPLLLAIDDLQWADGLSLGLLARLGTAEVDDPTARLVVLSTYRTEESGAWLDSLLDLPRTLHVELGRLDADQVGRVVADMLGVAEPPRDLAAFVAEASEGNPFFVGEYLRTALDAGLLSRDEHGRWHRDERALGPSSLALPQTIRALIERRLSALSGEGRALVGLAAVIGREIDADLLVSIAARHLPSYSMSERAWVELLSELVARCVFSETGRGTLTFSHETLRRVAYESLPIETRTHLHGRVAVALEALTEEKGDDELAAELAHHHERAHDFRRAVDFLERAGERLLSRSAHADAAACFREALRIDKHAHLAVSDLRRARWHALAGQALQGLGHLAESKHHLTRAVALFGWSAAESPFGVGMQIAWEATRQVLHRLLGLGDRRISRRGQLLGAARAYDHLLQVHYFEADRLGLAHAMLMTLNLAERAGPSPELASAYANTFAALSLAPALRSVAAAYLSRAEQALGDAPDPAVESYLALVRGVQLAGEGRWEDAEPCIRRAVAIAEKLGYRRRWEEGMAILAYNHGLRGDPEHAIAEADAVARSAMRGDPQTRCWSLLVQAQAKLALGGADDACRALATAEELARSLGRDEQVWVGGLLAAAELERGEAERAERAAERTLEAIGNGLPMVSASGEAYAAVADVWVELCRRDKEARGDRLRRATLACRALDRVARAFPFMEPRALLCRGDLARLLGRERHARSAWTRSIIAARRCQLERVALAAEGRLAGENPRALRERAHSERPSH
jgi:serine/threonine protein kinase/tetratricopeptide (TPR) repeat protein